MKYLKYSFVAGSLLLLTLLLSSCATDMKQKEQNGALVQESVQTVEKAATVTAPTLPASLPVRYQTASYVVDRDEAEDISIAEESTFKVGADITSRGPQPLVDILKPLSSIKKMNVSWASDVDKNVLVDVNISANDDFYTALDNILRQVDYYHEMQGSTIIIKYKETKQFQISMPFIKQTYKTNTGGDVLGGSTGGEANTNVAGEISLLSDGVAINQHNDGKPGGIEFNTWNSIENNLNAILDIWSTEEIENTASSTIDQTESANATTGSTTKQEATTATFRRSSGKNTYYIDKPVGLITVTAPRPLIEKLDAYFKSLKRELYKQISIEAKIIEVQMDDHSAIGLDWNRILENLTASAGYSAGETYSKNTTTNWTSNIINNIAGTTATSGLSSATIIADGITNSLSGAISLAAFSFDSFLNVVSEQGQTNILSNPKLSVLNGQPALMTVGRNTTYIDKVESTEGDGIATTSITTARALSGVGLALTANILDDNQIILNLVPVTSELESIEERIVGSSSVGLPIISVREMSTTVKVKNGEMLVIGGLISSNASEDGSFIPGTRNIPFFKYLFGFEEKTKSKRELIILLRPQII